MTKVEPQMSAYYSKSAVLCCATDLHFSDSYDKAELPINVILGIGKVTKFKTSTNQCVGNSKDPLAENTRFGWKTMDARRRRKV